MAGRFTNQGKKSNRDSRIEYFSNVKEIVGKEPVAIIEGTRQRKIVVRM